MALAIARALAAGAGDRKSAWLARSIDGHDEENRVVGIGASAAFRLAGDVVPEIAALSAFGATVGSNSSWDSSADESVVSVAAGVIAGSAATDKASAAGGIFLPQSAGALWLQDFSRTANEMGVAGSASVPDGYLSRAASLWPAAGVEAAMACGAISISVMCNFFPSGSSCTLQRKAYAIDQTASSPAVTADGYIRKGLKPIPLLA
ncbi:MAG: hypothetical protein Q8O52_09730 [Sulfuritalea sp.]|nr:hypothetical protein [Sulfuritalea sp.]